MVGVVADRVVVELEAKIDRYLANSRKAEIEFKRRMGGIQNSVIGMERQVQRSTEASGRFFRRFVSAIAIGAVIRETGELSDAFTEAANKIGAAEEISGRQARSLGELKDAANGARAAFEPYVDLYARYLRATKDVAKNEEEVARAADLTAKAFAAGGAATSERIAATLQLGQALQSGYLGGDELRSIRENAPLVASAIAREFETTIGGLKKLGEEGKLVSDRVFRAILKAQPEIEAAFARTNATIEDSFTRLRNSLIEYIGTSEAVKGAADAVRNAVNDVADNIDDYAEAAVIAASVIGGALAGRALGQLIQSLAVATAAEARFQAALASGNAVAIKSAEAARQRAEFAVKQAAADLEAAVAAERKTAAEVKSAAAVRSSVAAEVQSNNQLLRTAAANEAAARSALAKAKAQVSAAEATKVQTVREVELQRALRASGAANTLSRAAARDQAATNALTRSRTALVNAERQVAAAQIASSNAQKALIASRTQLAGAERLATAATNEQTVATQRLAGAEVVATKTSTALTAAKARLTIGARAATIALTALNRTLAFFGGPVGAAIFAITTGLTLLALRSEKARVTFEEFDETAGRLKKTLESIDSDQQRLQSLEELRDKNEDITEAMEAQGIASRETLILEIDSIKKRIKANQDLADTYRATLRVQVASLEAGVRATEGQISAIREARREAERIFQSQFEDRPSGVRVTGAGPNGEVLSREDLKLTEDQINDIIEARSRELEVASKIRLLTAQEREDLALIQKLREDNLSLAEKQAALGALSGTGVTIADIQGVVRKPSVDDPTGLSEDQVTENEKLLKRLEDAYNSLFDTEIQGIERVRRERLAAIDESTLSEEKKIRERVRVNAIADEEIIQAKRRQAEEEIDLVNSVLDARDRAAGRTIDIARREFEFRRAQIEREIQDERRKAEALDAIDAEQAEFERQAREELPGNFIDDDSLQAEIDRIRSVEAAKLEELQNALEQRLIAEEDYERRRQNVIAESEAIIRDLRAKELEFQLSTTASTFGKLADVTKKFAGEQSGIYRTLFAIQQSFAVASAVVSTANAVTKALESAPPPINFINAAVVAAAGAAEIATIVAASFAQGGEVKDRDQKPGMIRGPGTGTSDSINANVPTGSFVVNARATRNNRRLLEDLQRTGAGAGRKRTRVRISNGEFLVSPEVTRENRPLLEALNDGQRFGFQSGGAVGDGPQFSPNVAVPNVNVSAPDIRTPIVQVSPPEVNLTSINAIDAGDVVARGFDTRPGAKAILNFMSENKKAIQTALK